MRKVLLICLALCACGPQPRDLPIGVYKAPPTADATWGHAATQEAARQAAILLAWDTACGGDARAHRELLAAARVWFGGYWLPAIEFAGDLAARDVPPDRYDFCVAAQGVRDMMRIKIEAHARDMGDMPSVNSILSVRGLGVAFALAPKCPRAKPLDTAFVYGARREADRLGMNQTAIFRGMMLAQVAQSSNNPSPDMCDTVVNVMQSVVTMHPMPKPAAPKPTPKPPVASPPIQAPGAKPKPDPMFDI